MPGNIKENFELKSFGLSEAENATAPAPSLAQAVILSFNTASGPIHIRPAVASDIGAAGDRGIRDLFNAVRKFERHNGRSPLAPPQYAYWAAAMAHQARGNHKFQMMVAEQNAEIVGFCMATHLAHKPHSTLNNLFIAAHLHRTGIGRRLLELVELQSRHLGKEELKTCAESGEGHASGFYQRLGFEIRTTEPLKNGGAKDMLRLPLKGDVTGV